MASIQMNMGTETEINATPNKDGLILFDTTNKKIILDNNGTREVLTKHIEANPNLNGAEQLENLKVNGEVLNFLPVDISNVEKDGEEISDILEDKYDTEGDYNTTVDKCTDLTRVAPVTDTAPYIYRQTPVKESFKALMKKIVGASIVWNQLGFQTGVLATGTYSPLFKKQGENFKVNTISGHKYYMSFIQPANCKVYRQNRTGLTVGYLVYSTPTVNTRQDFVGSCTESQTQLDISGIISKSETTEESYNLTNCMFVDLTAMFGTTIADYVNTLETSQSGSGIAWLQSYGFFTEDYYAYKQNKLESGCVSAKKIVETNQAKMDNANNPNRSSFSYTKETAQSIVGTKTVGGGNFFAQFEIDLISGKTYTFSFGKFETNGTENANVNVYIYSDRLWGTSIKANWNVSKDGSTWTSTYNGKAYVGIFTTASVDTVLELDGFMASISGSTSFEPYTETTYPISPITLRGLFKLSIDKLTVDGDEYNADGSVTRKRKRLTPTDIFEYYSTYDSTTNLYRSNLKDNLNAITNSSGATNPSNAISNFDTCEATWNEMQNFDHSNKIGLYHNSGWNYTRLYISIADTSVTTKEQAETWIRNNIEAIEYEIATPTTEQTTPFTETEIVGSTEEFIDYEVAQSNRDVAIPVGTETDYYQSYNIPPIPFTDCYLSASNQILGWISNS